MNNLEFPKYYPVACHTNNVGPNTIFVAIKGQKENGTRYIIKALEQGARQIVVERDSSLSTDIFAAVHRYGAELTYVTDTRAALAQLSAQTNDYPAKKLRIVGVTGTKGKTSTTFILEHILRQAGFKTALLGTVKNIIDGHELPHELTTPQPDYLHQFFALCINQKVDFVIMEVAAQAFSLHRLDGIEFDMAIFTNFSQEHGEFYSSIQDYFTAKSHIIHHLKPHAKCLINADDTSCKALLANPQTQGFSLAKNYSEMPVRLAFEYCNQYIELSCPALIGTFNCYNVLVAATTALELGVPASTVRRSLEQFCGIPGRMERHLLPNGAQGIIDYAHNPSSLNAVLSTLRKLTDHLIVVFGCGGDRDAAKRPVMGQIAAQYADIAIITSDNPRSENPQTIIDEIYGGIEQSFHYKVIKELDRAQAIHRAYQHSHTKSIIALLGKGPDEYQLINGIKHFFSEKEILQRLS